VIRSEIFTPDAESSGGSQWFGDLVTCKDWGNWLNEGFPRSWEAVWTKHFGKDQATTSAGITRRVVRKQQSLEKTIVRHDFMIPANSTARLQ